jgi:hypothetical protein
MDGLADIDRVGAHLDRQRDLADHVARMGADDAAAQDPAVPVGLGRIVEQQLGEAFVAPVGDGAARRRPGEQALATLMPWALAWSSVRPTQATSGSV